MLKGLCSAGAHLSHCLGALACQSSACQARAVQCRAMWDHLSSATTAATAVVKNQAIASLQEAHTGTDIDSDQAETNQVRSVFTHCFDCLVFNIGCVGSVQRCLTFCRYFLIFICLTCRIGLY